MTTQVSNTQGQPHDPAMSYEIRESIGKGAFGDVYLVIHKATKKKYVLKRIKLARQNEWQRASTRQEIELVSSLKHPFIVPYIEHWVQHGHTINIIYGYCEKGDCQSQLQMQKGKLYNEEQLKVWLCEMALAIEYMHRKRVLHRDLKTQNLLMTTDGDLQIADFGLATFRSEGEDAKHDQALVGTPHYMSPELLSQKKYGFEIDLWSLGCIAYEWSSLRPPFDAFNLTGLVTKIRRGPTPIPPTSYSQDWTKIIKCLLRKEPEKRSTVYDILSLPYLQDALAIAKERGRIIMPDYEYPDIQPPSPLDSLRLVNDHNLESGTEAPDPARPTGGEAAAAAAGVRGAEEEGVKKREEEGVRGEGCVTQGSGVLVGGGGSSEADSETQKKKKRSAETLSSSGGVTKPPSHPTRASTAKMTHPTTAATRASSRTRPMQSASSTAASKTTSQPKLGAVSSSRAGQSSWSRSGSFGKGKGAGVVVEKSQPVVAHSRGGDGSSGDVRSRHSPAISHPDGKQLPGRKEGLMTRSNNDSTNDLISHVDKEVHSPYASMATNPLAMSQNVGEIENPLFNDNVDNDLNPDLLESTGDPLTDLKNNALPYEFSASQTKLAGWPSSTAAKGERYALGDEGRDSIVLLGDDDPGYGASRDDHKTMEDEIPPRFLSSQLDLKSQLAAVAANTAIVAPLTAVVPPPTATTIAANPNLTTHPSHPLRGSLSARPASAATSAAAASLPAKGPKRPLSAAASATGAKEKEKEKEKEGEVEETIEATGNQPKAATRQIRTKLTNSNPTYPPPPSPAAPPPPSPPRTRAPKQRAPSSPPRIPPLPSLPPRQIFFSRPCRSRRPCLRSSPRSKTRTASMTAAVPGIQGGSFRKRRGSESKWRCSLLAWPASMKPNCVPCKPAACPASSTCSSSTANEKCFAPPPEPSHRLRFSARANTRYSKPRSWVWRSRPWRRIWISLSHSTSD